MPAITLRSVKGSALTQAELDTNLSAIGSAAGSFFTPSTTGVNGLGLAGVNNPALYANSTKVIDWTLAGAAVTGTFSATGLITASAGIDGGAGKTIRVVSGTVSPPGSGKGVELFYDGVADQGGLIAYDRTGAAYKALGIYGSSVIFPEISTTASAANAYLNNAASNSLLRSTSSLAFKRDLTPFTLEEARAITFGREAFSYASASKADDPNRRWVGYGAEHISPVDKRFVTFDKDGQPNWVQYERWVVPHGLILEDHEEKIEGMRAWKAKAQTALAEHGITIH